MHVHEEEEALVGCAGQCAARGEWDPGLRQGGEIEEGAAELAGEAPTARERI